MNSIQIQKVSIVSQVIGDESFTTDGKEILADDWVVMFPLIEALKDGERVYICPDSNVKLNGREISTLTYWPEEEDSLEITWFKVETQYVSYSNSTGKYFSWAKINYVEHSFASGWFAWADVTPHREEIHEPRIIRDKTGRIIDYDSSMMYPNTAFDDRTGTMRYKVQIVFKGDTFSSPGSESVAYYGITDKVHRISKRRDNTLVGFATSFMNLPYIYGSAGDGYNHQADRYVGADCADLVTFAYRRYLKHKGFSIGGIYYTRGRDLVKFGKVIVPLGKISRSSTGFYQMDGEPIPYGEGGVKDGDVVLIYSTPESDYPWHVAMLVGDRSSSQGPDRGEANGVFDIHDLCIHTLCAPPVIQPVSWGDNLVIVRLRYNEDQ
jgi:cell wall-associated NlpC family hydrolase